MKTEEATHTPGPWEIELPSGDQEKDGILPSINATSFRGEICCGVFKKADAQLIAAAPMMLEACYSILNIEGLASAAERSIPAFEDVDVKYHFNKIREAIAKATGKREE